MKKFKISLLLLLFLLFSFFRVSDSFASAGWYPTALGEIIKVSFCVPNKKVPTKIAIQISPDGKSFRSVKAFMPKLIAKSDYCNSNQFEIRYKWVVNVKGSYGLYFYDSINEIRYFGFPDGIESK